VALELRPARSSDAALLAEVLETAGRGHLPRGPWDLLFPDAAERAAALGMLASQLPSWCHHTVFNVAELAGEPAAALAAFEPAAIGGTALTGPLAAIFSRLGWPEGRKAAAGPLLAPYLACFPDMPAGVWIVENVATRPAWRRRGLVAALLEHALAEGRRRGHASAQISCLIGNEAARHAYERAGFRPIEERKTPAFEALLGAPGFLRMTRPLSGTSRGRGPDSASGGGGSLYISIQKETSMSRGERVEAFRKLHEGPILVLPNAWDVASARVIEEAGAKAIATTSAGVAAVYGYPDGNQLPRALALAAVERIVKAVRVPVTADIEAGYGADAGEVCETVRGVIDAGAAGINLEDGKGEPEALAAKIAAIRGLAARNDLFVNARCDVYLNGATVGAESLDEVLRRAALYAQAGADGFFVPFLADGDTIRRICEAVPLPVNVLTVPGLAPPAELARLGVRRLSAGSSPMRAAMRSTRRLAKELLEQGSYDGLF
jgi:2-methylisocitrate lyase-like PEP mutase family enzyme/ribosomal protein S18 acetylase RimI-like enzyme